jgi:hypothetical protein
MLFSSPRGSILRFRRKKTHFSYGSRKYTNPYFLRKKRRNRPDKIPILTFKGKLVFIAVVITLIGFIWVLLYSPLLKITNVEVSIVSDKNSNIPPELHLNAEAIRKVVNDRLNERIYNIWPQYNLLLFSRSRLEKRLHAEFYYNSLTISKKLAHSLFVRIEEEEFVFIWQEENKYYFSDSQGDIIKEADVSSLDLKKFILVENQSDPKISGGLIINYDRLKNIFELLAGLKKNTLIQTERLVIDREKDVIKVKTINGPDLIFSFKEGDNTIPQQIIKLNFVLKETLNNKLAGLEYIDLRHGDRVFYK